VQFVRNGLRLWLLDMQLLLNMRLQRMRGSYHALLFLQWNL
jgi:hypothetical protein